MQVCKLVCGLFSSENLLAGAVKGLREILQILFDGNISIEFQEFCSRLVLLDPFFQGQRRIWKKHWKLRFHFHPRHALLVPHFRWEKTSTTEQRLSALTLTGRTGSPGAPSASWLEQLCCSSSAQRHRRWRSTKTTLHHHTTSTTHRLEWRIQLGSASLRSFMGAGVGGWGGSHLVGYNRGSRSWFDWLDWLRCKNSRWNHHRLWKKCGLWYSFKNIKYGEKFLVIL